MRLMAVALAKPYPLVERRNCGSSFLSQRVAD
jgi:hypothetical protein